MGEIITFYSYKGGSGRSMALANTAAFLAVRASHKKVLMIDWDLEAPGLEHYFKEWIGEASGRLGIFDFIELSKKEFPAREHKNNQEPSEPTEEFFKRIESYLIPVRISNDADNLFLIKAGNVTGNYSDRINRFNWTAFFKQIPGFFTLFSKYLAEKFDYVLVDSRTGHTDIGGICTMLLPEKLVLVFTPNEQGLEGVLQLAKKAAEYRMKSADLRPLRIYPLPSRVELQEDNLRNDWKGKYQNRFEDLFKQIYGLPSTISLEQYFNRVLIPHASRYAYGEKVAVLEETAGISSISENYQAFTMQLVESKEIWTNEPFSGLASPYQVYFLFADKDRSQVESFTRHISPLARQNAIALSHPDTQLSSIEQLDDHTRRKIGSGGIDFIVLFLSPALMEQKEKWLYEVNEMLNRSNGLGKYKIIPILLDKVELLDEFDGIPVFPSRRKPVNESSNLDETWTDVSVAFRQRLIIYKEKTQSDTNDT